MKRKLVLTIAMLVSGNIFAATDHYVLRDGGYVRHLKVTSTNDEFHVSADVDFESTTNNGNSARCSSQISGDAKSVGKDELVMKKHSESEASYCELKIQLSPNGAKIDQSKACDNFVVSNCRFSSDGKELIRIK
ncbi:MAG: hypothetical protein PHG00_17115 [Methylococcales bacterium]|nr:hypothetical protein [Methylococcales bacterium]